MDCPVRRMWIMRYKCLQVFLCLQVLSLKTNINLSNKKTKPLLLTKTKEPIVRLLLSLLLLLLLLLLILLLY